MSSDLSAWARQQIEREAAELERHYHDTQRRLRALDDEARSEPRVSTVLRLGDRASRATLEDHYLAQIVCDHDRKMDNPICSCSRVFLGWHPSVGAAVRAWVDHVMEVEHAGS